MKLPKKEIAQAQAVLIIAIGLQFAVWLMNREMFSGFQYIVIAVELALVLLIGVTNGATRPRSRSLYHSAATALIAVVTAANFAALGVIVYALVTGDITSGAALLGSALAIFFTNVIVYALWYWEIDSPGLTLRRWTRNDKDFQFTQQNMPLEFPGWKPEFIDYLYISIINSMNGANTGAQALTRNAKLLMASQAIVSIFTLALVIARSVGILGT